MKHQRLLLTALVAIPAIGLLTSGALDSTGKFANTGSPGESTCSQVNCHGAGNGQGSTGGLPDNAGPGNITLTSSPAFLNGNQYVPGQTYHMTVTVSEAGKSLFGFDFEALDNSGNTDPFTNNSTGTITVTDAVHTRMGQPAHIFNGQVSYGRVNITHKTGGGAFQNSAAFNFDWTAPASGTVNLFAAGNAANGDGLENAQDNVYKLSKQLVPQLSNGIAAHAEEMVLEAYPNPAVGSITVRTMLTGEESLRLELLSLEGRVIRVLAQNERASGMYIRSFPLEGLEKGYYVLRVAADHYARAIRLCVE